MDCIRGDTGAYGSARERRARRCAVFLLALALAACSLDKANSLAGGNSEAEAKKDAEWSYRERGVVLNVTADPGLNEYGGLAHAVVLVIAQTAEPAAFNTFVKSPQNVGKALSSGEAPGVLNLERVYIEPGSTQRVVLDRVDKARYIGVAAAYFEGDPARNARVFAIGVDVKTTGFVVKNSVATPLPLGLSVRLGDKALLYARATEVAEPLPDRAGEVPPAAPARPADPFTRVEDRTGPGTRLAAEHADGNAGPLDLSDGSDAAVKAPQRPAARFK